MFQKILLAYDGSQGAHRALDVALELAHLYHAELWALAVEEHLPHFAATIDEVDVEKEQEDQACQEALSVAYLRALQAGIELKSAVRPGHTAQAIIEFSREAQCDLIVLGRSKHAHTWATMLLGTTAQKVSQRAPCSVLLVR